MVWGAGIMFEDRLLKVRKQKGWTQKEAAEKAEIQPSTYSAYENNKKSPPLDIAVRLANAFGVSLEWLCGREKGGEELYTYGDAARAILKVTAKINSMGKYNESAVINPNPKDNIAYRFDLEITSEDLYRFFDKAMKYEELVREVGDGGELLSAWMEKGLIELDKKTMETEELPF